MPKRASKKTAKQKPLFDRVAKKPKRASKRTAAKGKETPKLTPREKLRATIKEYRRQLAIGAACYGKADELFAEIRKKVKPGTRIPMSEGLWAVIVDLFENDAKIWKPVAMKRFELQIQDASGRAVRMRDRKKKAARK